MKFFSLLFSFYVLLLTAVPCVDAVGCNLSLERMCLEATHDSGHGHGDDSDCTPFCTCNCCGCQGFNVASFYTVSANADFRVERPIAVYTFSFCSEFSSKIWQPPKI